MAASDLLYDLDDLETDADEYVTETKECSKKIRELSKKLSDAEDLIKEASACAKELRVEVSTFGIPADKVPCNLEGARQQSNKKIKIVNKVSKALAENMECGWIYARYAATMQSNVNAALEQCHENLTELVCSYKKRNEEFERSSDIVSNVGVDVFQWLPNEMVVFILSMIGNPCVKAVCRRFRDLYDEGENQRIRYRYMQPKPLVYRVSMPLLFRVCPSTNIKTKLVSGSGISFLVDERSLAVGDFTYQLQTDILRIYIGQSLVLLDVERNRVVFDLKNEQWFDWTKVQLHLMNDSDPITYEALDLDTDNIVCWRGNRFVVCTSAGEVVLETEAVDYERPYQVDAGYGRIVAGFDCSVSEGTVQVHVIFCATTGKKLFEKSTTYGLAYNCAFGVVIEGYFERWYIIGQKMWKIRKGDMDICCIDGDGNMIMSKGGEATFCHEKTAVYMVY